MSERVDFGRSLWNQGHSTSRPWHRGLTTSFLAQHYAVWAWPVTLVPSARTHLKDVRRAWAKALKAAGLEYFWVYDLRHTFVSRLTEAGVSPVFVAQIMGHSSPNILQTYAKAIDEYRRSAISKLETLRETHKSKP